MNEVWIEVCMLLLRVVIVLCVGAVTKYALPWLTDTVIPWLKDKRVYSTICRFVRAAEKLAETGAIERADKKSYVVGLLNAKGITVTPEVEAMIESAVLELDLAIDEIGALFFDAMISDDDDDDYYINDLADEDDGDEDDDI